MNKQTTSKERDGSIGLNSEMRLVRFQRMDGRLVIISEEVICEYDS